MIQTKIKGGCQSRRKVVPYDSKSDLPLVVTKPMSSMITFFSSLTSDKTQISTLRTQLVVFLQNVTGKKTRQIIELSFRYAGNPLI